MTENRFEYTAYDDGTESIYDRKKDEYYFDMQLSNIEELLNDLSDENEQLKQSVNNLKDTIIKITIAYQRKYDRNIVDLVDEVHDEDITDLIKELQE